MEREWTECKKVVDKRWRKYENRKGWILIQGEHNLGIIGI